MRWFSVFGLILSASLIFLLAFTGSGDVVDPSNVQDDAARPAGNLTDATTIGQTFVAHAARLSAIQVRWVVSDDFSSAPNSRVILHLRQRVDDSTDLAVASIPLSEIRHNQFSTFRFSPIPDSQGQTYYFILDAAQAEITRGWLSVWASDDDALPDGQMYFDSSTTEHDLAFRVFSSPDLFFALAAFGKTFARESAAIPIAALIFLVPGLALYVSFRALRLRSGSTPREISAETLAMIGGLSLATLSAASLGLLWLRLPAGWLVGVMGVLVIAAILAIRNRGYTIPQPTRVYPEARRVGWNCREAMLLSILVSLSLAVGFIQFAELPTPLWVDSYAHASYIKEFLDQGRLPLEQIYHLGYHSIVALLIQLSGMSIPQAMLLFGQLIVTQIGLSFFLFGKRLANSAVVGFASAICVWFLTPTPVYFLTWGRYPLLLGTAILPIALVAAMNLIEPPRFDARAFFLAVVTLAGLAFAHIRLLAFYVVFVALYLAWHNLRARRLGASVGRIALLAVVGALIGVVWLAALASQHDVAQDLGTRVAVVSAIDLPTALAVMQSHHGSIVWAMAAIGVVVAFARRSPSALIVVAWFAALLAIAALLTRIGAQMLDVPFIILLGFVPAALLVGELARVVCHQTCKVFGDWSLIWVGIGLLVSLLGAREMLSIVNPTTILFTRADERAMTWIQANTPNDARFLVNSFAWYPTIYVPSDGGGWIPYTTNRAIVFADNAIAPEALADWMATRKITYVYVGRRAGVLHARDFAGAPERYTLVYEAEGVRIWMYSVTQNRQVFGNPSHLIIR